MPLETWVVIIGFIIFGGLMLYAWIFIHPPTPRIPRSRRKVKD